MSLQTISCRPDPCIGHIVPLYIDAFVGSQEVQAVQNSVAGHLDVIHWGKRERQCAF